MKVIKDETDITPTECQGVVLTGNGSAETHRLPALASHFDDDDVLLFPHGSQKTIRNTRTGANPTMVEDLKGVSTLRGISHYLPSYDTFIIIIDREYVEHHDDLEDEMRVTLLDILPGNTTIDTTNLSEGTYHLNVDGPLPLTVYATFVGREIPQFEDRMRCLLNMVWDLEIPSETDQDIKEIITEHLNGWNRRKEFIRERRREEIEIAFPDLSRLFCEFEDV